MAEFLKSPSDAVQLTSPVISFMNSQKGKLMLVINDYIFKLNRESKTTKYWICIFNGCLSKVHTALDNQLIEFINQHNHPSENEKNDVFSSFFGHTLCIIFPEKFSSFHIVNKVYSLSSTN
jgi:hypothetical protein